MQKKWVHHFPNYEYCEIVKLACYKRRWRQKCFRKFHQFHELRFEDQIKMDFLREKEQLHSKSDALNEILRDGKETHIDHKNCQNLERRKKFLKLLKTLIEPRKILLECKNFIAMVNEIKLLKRKLVNFLQRW